MCFVGGVEVENIGDGGTEQIMIGSDEISYLHHTSPDCKDPMGLNNF